MKNFLRSFLFTILFGLAFAQGVFYYYFLEVPSYLSQEEITKRFKAESAAAELKLTGNWWPPRVGIRTPVIHNDYAAANITVSSNEEIIATKLPEGWRLYGPQVVGKEFFYLILIPQVVPGENRYQLEFSNASGNLMAKEVFVVGAIQPLQTPSWPNTEFTIDGDNPLSLANKQYQLPQDYEPQDLVLLTDLGITNTNSARLRKEAAESLQKMAAEITKAGINYNVTSGYRSFSDQVRVYNYWIKYYGGDIAATDQVSARPGYSEHQLGLAVDFTTSANENMFYLFETTPLSKWLAVHASEYGFVISYPQGKTDITGYTYEPWHYRYVGIENAKKVVDSGLTLTEWLLQQRGSLQ